jgi:uncharacterized protein (DUF58 family)
VSAPAESIPAPLLSLADISAIELLVLRRMSEMTGGDHHSLSHGTGFDIRGLRDWQAGDRFAAIDWAQSSLNNFAPMVVREFEQPSTATVVAIADSSLSTRCGIDGVPIAATVARAIATLGLSASFFQDPFGLITFDAGFGHLAALRPRSGKSHVMHCVDAYQYRQNLLAMPRSGGIGATLGGYLHRTSMLPVISDFLFDDAQSILRELAYLNARHDVFIVLIDSAFAFEMPDVSAGWVEAVDIETGLTRTLSKKTLRQMAERIRSWQAEVKHNARALGLDVVSIGRDQLQTDIALSEFVAERRLRKPYN